MFATRIAPALLAGLLLSGLACAQSSITILAGNRQAVARSGAEVPGGVAAFEPLAVLVKDAQGKPVAGATVNFECGTRPPTMVCQLESFGAARADASRGAASAADQRLPVPAQLTPTGWTTSGGQVVAAVESTRSAKAGAGSILAAVPAKSPTVRVTTDARGVATLQLMRGKSAWAYGADGDLAVKASHESGAVEFKLAVRM